MAEKEAFESAMETAVTFVTSHIYLTLFVLVALHLAVYRLLRNQPHSLWKSDPLKISEIYIYPIKSLRGTRVSEAVASQHGFAYDRTFMLLQVTDDGLKNMAVSKYPEMTQFLTSIDLPDAGERNGYITVDYAPRGAKANMCIIPLEPDTEKLEPLDITMHRSPTKAFKMPAKYNQWFSTCFGYEVVLAYLGDNRRDVLFEDLKPKKSGILSKSEGAQITFADCAPYLIVSMTSVGDVSRRLPDGEEMDITKFRPNIVLEGAAKAWEEDHWGGLNINGVELHCAHNCVRCKSLNIDYATGKPGTGESGQVLKKLQKDRRIDTGAKWSPVFGRYAYWKSKDSQSHFKVGDDVLVTQLNEKPTTFTWPGLG